MYLYFVLQHILHATLASSRSYLRTLGVFLLETRYPVGHFLGYNGPAEIVGYDWDRARGVFVHPLLVQLRPTVLTRPDAKQQKLNCAVQRLGR